MQLQIKDVSKNYRVDGETVPAVSRASLALEAGEFISIVGHSGSGKTTLLSIIGGIARPTSGSVLFEGRDLYEMGSDELSVYRADKIGFMFQFASLLPMLTVQENLVLPTAFRSSTAGRQDGGAAQKAEDLIRRVGLIEKLHAYPSQLSGGQQRRVAIARAFMNDPAVILADEPTGDLDEDTEQEMMDFFSAMNVERGITFLMITHNTELAGRTRRRLRMQKGVLEERE